MKTTHKTPRALTYRKAMSKARKYIKLLRSLPQGAPNWMAVRDMAMLYKGHALELSRSDNELSEASQL